MISVQCIGDLADARDSAKVLDLLDHCNGLIGIYDENENLRFSNVAFRDAYFVETGERLSWTALMRRNFEAGRGTVIQTEDIDAWLSSVRSRRGKSSRRTYESDLHDGRWIWVVETMCADGWIVYFGTDVTSLNASERHLRHARDLALQESQTDHLTGISNRKHIMAQLEILAEEATRIARPTGYACLIDLDHFKSVNDTWGHAVGDQLLTSFARCVRQLVRLRDGFGRVGGEEFLLLLTDATASDCRRIFNSLYTAVRDTSLVPDQPQLTATFSAGLCPIAPQKRAKDIYAQADRALYQAKSEGRDRLIIHDEAG
jgi:diguanylate cyclase (GGDEF)-like protein